MDARPQRARVANPAMGNENVATAIHQRHKSTSNLQGASRAGGLQAAAKRTVFGDVSNVVKNLANGAGGVALGKGKGEVPVKANIQQPSQGFSKPAQRLVTASSKPELKNVDYYKPSQGINGTKLSVLKESQPDYDHRQATMPASVAPQYLDLETSLGLDRYDPPSLANVGDGFDAEALANSDSALRTTLEPSVPAPISNLTLQPRHHKSQPVLKRAAEAQAQALRRTQSKQFVAQSFEPIEQDSCKYLDDVTEASYEDALEHLLDDQRTGPIGVHDLGALDNSVEKPESCPSDSQQSPALEIDPKLAGPEDQIRSPATVGLEEYWDELEEEELYDEQGYTTAHSYRSRGDLTTGGVTAVLAPRVTGNTERELEIARQHVELNRTQEDIDDDMWDVCMVAEYGDDIFAYLHELEEKMMPDPHYMDHQTEIQWSMRSVLMDWLVQVHGRFSLLPETLFLAINYIDRFLTYKAVSIGKLQLVGATALLIASKYEEINCPSLEEIVFMVDGSYSTDEILKAERFMLSMLGFELGWPGPMSFLRRISKADEYDLETRTLAKYFLEVTIMDERFVASPPSFLAAGAHCLSRMMLKKGDWSLAHVHYSGYTWTQLKPLVTMMLECCYNAQKHHLAVYEKYTDKRYKKASEYVQAELLKGFMLPSRSPASTHRMPDMGDFDTDASLVHHSVARVPVELQG